MEGLSIGPASVLLGVVFLALAFWITVKWSKAKSAETYEETQKHYD